MADLATARRHVSNEIRHNTRDGWEIRFFIDFLEVLRTGIANYLDENLFQGYGDRVLGYPGYLGRADWPAEEVNRPW